jgi:hypothetical protein
MLYQSAQFPSRLDDLASIRESQTLFWQARRQVREAIMGSRKAICQSLELIARANDLLARK